MGFQSEKGDRSSRHALFDSEQTSAHAKIQDREFRISSANEMRLARLQGQAPLLRFKKPHTK